MALKRFDPSKFTTSKAKPLPVILLLDVSGSMGEVMDGSYERTGQTVFDDGQSWEIVKGGLSRIDVLNQAVLEMIASFVQEEQREHEFLVSVITFGGSVRMHLPPTKASRVAWQSLTAAGETPLGEAIAMAKSMIEDKETMPSRAYRPVVVLVSDGKPTDRWEAHLDSFVGSGRSMKCDRIALAIGAGTDEEMLQKFIAGTPNALFHASDASHVLDTFRRVTLSVTVRSKSENPNQAPPIADLTTASPASPKPASEAKGPSPAGDADDDYW
jgi:uncharacterized protein YegL